MNISLPYVDGTISELEAGNRDLIDKHGQHMHWGYWRDTKDPDTSIDGYKAAADEMVFQHFDMARIRPGHKILEVGCGFGGAIILLNEHYENIDVTGSNIDSRQIEWARKTVAPQVRPSNRIAFDVADACALPYPDASFDTVYAIECIFHFSSRKKFLEEAHRVLRPGGILVVSDLVVRVSTLGLMMAIEPWYRQDFRRSYGEPNPPFSEALYRLAGRLVGLPMVDLRDVTSNTLPTCKALRHWNGRMERLGLGAAFERANRYLELTARMRMVRYQLYAFEKRR